VHGRPFEACGFAADAVRTFSVRGVEFPGSSLDSPAWDARTRYIQDGGIEIDNNAAERSLRGVALVRKNYLFAGSAR